MRCKEIEITHRTLSSVEGFLRGEHDGIGDRAYLVNVEPLTCSNAKAPALAWCVEGNAVVLAQGLPSFIDKEARFPGLGNLFFNKGTVVSLRDEADLLTFLQLIGWEAQGLSFSPDVRFVQVAQGEEELGQPVRAEAVEKISLVLAIISGPCKDWSAAIKVETSVMSCRYMIEMSGGGEIDESPNLHSLVTTDTGIGCRTGRIAVKKIVNDSFPKGGAGIDDFVGDVENLGDVLSDADLATPPLLPLFGC
jgi:hypothetical protein